MEWNGMECIHYHYNKTLFSKCLITVIYLRDVRRRLRLSCLLFQKAKMLILITPPRSEATPAPLGGATPSEMVAPTSQPPAVPAETSPFYRRISLLADSSYAGQQSPVVLLNS